MYFQKEFFNNIYKNSRAKGHSCPFDNYADSHLLVSVYAFELHFVCYSVEK